MATTRGQPPMVNTSTDSIKFSVIFNTTTKAIKFSMNFNTATDSSSA